MKKTKQKQKKKSFFYSFFPYISHFPPSLFHFFLIFPHFSFSPFLFHFFLIFFHAHFPFFTLFPCLVFPDYLSKFLPGVKYLGGLWPPRPAPPPACYATACKLKVGVFMCRHFTNQLPNGFRDLFLKKS